MFVFSRDKWVEQCAWEVRYARQVLEVIVSCATKVPRIGALELDRSQKSTRGAAGGWWLVRCGIIAQPWTIDL